jgi:hypothetical protein
MEVIEYNEKWEKMEKEEVENRERMLKERKD